MSRSTEDMLLRKIEALEDRLDREERHQHAAPDRNRPPSSGALTGVAMLRDSSQIIPETANTPIEYESVLWQSGTDVEPDLPSGAIINTPGAYYVTVHDSTAGGGGGVEYMVVSVGTPNMGLSFPDEAPAGSIGSFDSCVVNGSAPFYVLEGQAPAFITVSVYVRSFSGSGGTITGDGIATATIWRLGDLA